MSKEVLLVVESVSNEKGVPAGVIFEALELALATATKKRFEDEVDLRVEINRHNGSYETFRRWHVVADEDYQDPATEITVEDVQEQKPGAKVGEVIEERSNPSSSAASLRRLPSRSSCKRSARPSAPRWSMPTARRSARSFPVP